MKFQFHFTRSNRDNFPATPLTSFEQDKKLCLNFRIFQASLEEAVKSSSPISGLITALSANPTK